MNIYEQDVQQKKMQIPEIKQTNVTQKWNRTPYSSRNSPPKDSFLNTRKRQTGTTENKKAKELISMFDSGALGDSVPEDKNLPAGITEANELVGGPEHTIQTGTPKEESEALAGAPTPDNTTQTDTPPAENVTDPDAEKGPGKLKRAADWAGFGLGAVSSGFGIGGEFGGDKWQSGAGLAGSLTGLAGDGVNTYSMIDDFRGDRDYVKNAAGEGRRSKLKTAGSFFDGASIGTSMLSNASGVARSGIGINQLRGGSDKGATVTEDINSISGLASDTAGVAKGAFNMAAGIRHKKGMDRRSDVIGGLTDMFGGGFGIMANSSTLAGNHGGNSGVSRGFSLAGQIGKLGVSVLGKAAGKMNDEKSTIGKGVKKVRGFLEGAFGRKKTAAPSQGGTTPPDTTQTDATPPDPTQVDAALESLTETKQPELLTQP